MAGLSSGMYPSSYPTSEQNPYPSISMENSAFYGSLVSETQPIAFIVMRPNSHLFIEFIRAIKLPYIGAPE